MFKKNLKSIAFLILAAFIGFGSYIGFKYFYWQNQDSPLFNYTGNNNDGSSNSYFFSNEKREHKMDDSRKDIKNRPFSVLLLGTDTDSATEGRTDTIVVAIVDPELSKVSILAIPRDTRVFIPSINQYDKITHAYNGGIKRSLEAVETFLDIPMDYYMVIDFDGFQDLIDTLGGIEIDVKEHIRFPDRITGTNFTIEKGHQTLNGIQALNYARYRYGPDGDFGRNKRQLEVIEAIIDQSKDWRNIVKVKEILEILDDNIKTDLTLTDIVKILLNVHDISGNDVERLKIEATPLNISGISYVTVSDEEKLRIQEELKSLLLREKEYE